MKDTLLFTLVVSKNVSFLMPDLTFQIIMVLYTN